MKKICLSFFCIIYLGASYAQDTADCYFDEQLQLTSKKNASYNGRLIQQDGKWESFAYYSNGTILFHGFFKDKKLTEKEGEYTLYFPNGIRRVVTYFDDNKIDSIFTSWYANGNRSDSGLMRGNIKEGLWKTWYTGGAVESEGNYINGSPDGIWHWYHNNGSPATVETYKNRKLNDLACFDTLGNNTGSNCRIDMKPCPEKALSFDQFVVDNMIYPEKALKRGIEGTVNFEFFITKEGRLTRINFLNETNALLQDEVVKFLKSIPKWEPAVSHNRNIDYLYTYEIPFYLPQ
jgi:TonB family protein